MESEIIKTLISSLIIDLYFILLNYFGLHLLRMVESQLNMKLKSQVHWGGSNLIIVKDQLLVSVTN